MSETGIIVYGVAIIVLLVLSAFFSMSETGLTAASPPRIHHLEGQGKQRATVVLRLLERRDLRSEEHTSELQSLMRISYAVFCLKQKKRNRHINNVITAYT